MDEPNCNRLILLSLPQILWLRCTVSERFADLKIEGECILLFLGITLNRQERRALLHRLRLVINELDSEALDALPSLLGDDFTRQMDSLSVP